MKTNLYTGVSIVREYRVIHSKKIQCDPWPHVTEWFIVTRYSVFHDYSCQGKNIFFFFFLNSYPTQPSHFISSGLVSVKFGYPPPPQHTNSPNIQKNTTTIKICLNPKQCWPNFLGPTFFLLICPWDPYLFDPIFLWTYILLLLTYMFLRPHFFVGPKFSTPKFFLRVTFYWPTFVWTHNIFGYRIF